MQKIELKTPLIFLMIIVLVWAVLTANRNIDPQTNSSTVVPEVTSSPMPEETFQDPTSKPEVIQEVKEGNIALTLTSPKNAQVVSEAVLTVSGITSSGAEVFVNESETVADSKGNFSVQITLDEGENLIVVLANDSEGNFIEQEVMVTYTP